MENITFICCQRNGKDINENQDNQSKYDVVDDQRNRRECKAVCT